MTKLENLEPQRTQRNAEEGRKNKPYRGFTRMSADQEHCQKCKIAKHRRNWKTTFTAEVAEERREKIG
jgi:hypothetical protein